MKIESAEDLLEEFSDIKPTIKIAQKMFKEAYKDQIFRLKKLDKMLKAGLNSNEPVDMSTLVAGMLGIDNEFQRLYTDQYIQNRLILGVMGKSIESIVAVNAI